VQHSGGFPVPSTILLPREQSRWTWSLPHVVARWPTEHPRWRGPPACSLLLHPSHCRQSQTVSGSVTPRRTAGPRRAAVLGLSVLQTSETSLRTRELSMVSLWLYSQRCHLTATPLESMSCRHAVPFQRDCRADARVLWIHGRHAGRLFLHLADACILSG